MRINTKATNCELTPQIQAYLDERIDAISRLIGEHDDDAVKCSVEIEKTRPQQHGLVWRAEMNLSIEGKMYRAEATAESVNAALDEVKDEMMKRLRRSKKKHRDLFRRGRAKIKDWMKFGKQ